MMTAPLMPVTRVVLAQGRATPRASLLVSIDLGLGFSALSVEMQRQAIERALSDALVLAEAKLSPEEEACPLEPVGSAA